MKTTVIGGDRRRQQMSPVLGNGRRSLRVSDHRACTMSGDNWPQQERQCHTAVNSNGVENNVIVSSRERRAGVQGCKGRSLLVQHQRARWLTMVATRSWDDGQPLWCLARAVRVVPTCVITIPSCSMLGSGQGWSMTHGTHMKHVKVDDQRGARACMMRQWEKKLRVFNQLQLGTNKQAQSTPQ